ncbi:MAG: hypothetical protein LBI13_09205 [Streptococcaceae bacterium]|jgi:hypothetical protein|nr:hypothetical protein [Streptococcaceae bacterium]
MNFGIIIFVLVGLLILLLVLGSIMASKVNTHYLISFKSEMSREQQETLINEIGNKFVLSGYKQVRPENGAQLGFQKGLIRKWPAMGIFNNGNSIEFCATSWKYRKQLFVEFPTNPGIFRMDSFCKQILEEYATRGYATDVVPGLKNAR